jgi:hypothetical protein
MKTYVGQRIHLWHPRGRSMAPTRDPQRKSSTKDPQLMNGWEFYEWARSQPIVTKKQRRLNRNKASGTTRS